MIVQGFAHAVQALEFKLAEAFFLGERDNARHRMGVVGSKLRKQEMPAFQQHLHAVQITEIGMGLVGEDRIFLQALLLGLLDFGVPVGTFHQPHRNLAMQAAGNIHQPLQHFRRAFLVGLHGQAKLAPLAQFAMTGSAGEQHQHRFQAPGFFRINGHGDVLFLCQQQQFHQRVVQLIHGFLLTQFKAWMQCRQLDGQTAGIEPVFELFGDIVDRAGVGILIALHVLPRHRRFAQHVEGMVIAFFGFPSGMLDCLDDGFAGDKLLANDGHGLADGGHGQRFPQPLHHVAQGFLEAVGVFFFMQQFAGEQ